MTGRRVQRLFSAVILTSILLLAIAPMAMAQEEPYSNTEVKGSVITPSPGVLAQAQESLPATGADTAPWLFAGLGLLLVGSVILVVARRRRASTPSG